MDAFGLTEAQLERAGAAWTAREIVQQPDTWAKTEALIEAQSSELSLFLGPLLEQPDLSIILTGAGTSAHIGTCLAPALSRVLEQRVAAIATTDIVASPASYLRDPGPLLLVSFARSGNSPESLAAVELAETCGRSCSHLILTCDRNGALCRRGATLGHAYTIVLPEESNDRSFAMTSSFTSMLLGAALALCALPAIVAGRGRSETPGALARQVLPELLPLLQTLVAARLQRIVYLGAKELYGVARESALKTLEMTDGQVVAIAETPLGFRHGPKTVINRDTVVVVYVSNDEYTRRYDLDLIAELRREAVARRVIALAGRALPPDPDNLVLQAPQAAVDVADIELCLPYITFAQSLALLWAVALKVPPDSPNAAGVVSRVVQGVTIHPWPASP